MERKIEPLKYLGVDTDVIVYKFGLCSYAYIEDSYRGSAIRNKTIYRIDAMYSLVGRYFTKATIDKYRQAIYYLMIGKVEDVNMISTYLLELANSDEVFRDALQDILLLNVDDNTSFGDAIFSALCSCITTTHTKMVSLFRGHKDFVICESDGYIYFSVDITSDSVIIPFNAECEVLSYGKIWCGNFKYL